MTRLAPTLASASLLVSSAAVLAVGAASSPFEGYWVRIDDAATYDSYLKVEADSGYRCVMDGKSSFRFKILDGSITTPMNGKDAIALTSSGRLRISGEEKGEPYESTFARMDPGEYPKACVDEEEAWYGPTAIRNRPPGPQHPQRLPSRSPAFGFGYRGDLLDALGRTIRAP